MNIQFTNQNEFKDAVWAVTLFEKEEEHFLPDAAVKAMRKKPHQPIVEVFVYEGSTTKRMLAVQLGLRHQSSAMHREELGAAIYKKSIEGNEETCILDLTNREEEGLDLAAGFLLASWSFNKYRTQIKPNENGRIETLVVLCRHPEEMKQKFRRKEAAIKGVQFACSLTSEPPNVLYPTAYAQRLKELEADGVAVEILDEKALEQIGMSALLAVGKGSMQASAVAVMTWNGLQEKSSPTVVVGKGVCFDSGGLCLKPTAHQHDMKWDKAGAGVVAGLMKALALSHAPVHVVGIVGLVENMPDGGASRPGDVIRTMSGQTVEIVNTDAEGRLVLADCLWYAIERYQPHTVIDLGTLTIETMACLGTVYAGLFSNSQKLAAELMKAGEISGDLLWQLPMGAPFAKQIESGVADMKNVGIDLCGENAAAAEFLKRFVKETPWAHIDIAGVSWIKEEHPLKQKGVTGFGVRLLEEWLNRD